MTSYKNEEIIIIQQNVIDDCMLIIEQKNKRLQALEAKAKLYSLMIYCLSGAISGYAISLILL